MSYLAKSLAAQLIRSAVDSIEFLTIGEMMSDELAFADLGPEAFHEIQIGLENLIRSAELTIEFEDGTLY